LLLATVLLAAAALWTLARVQPASITAPIGTVPLLAPFAVEASYAKLAADVARVQSRLEASLVVVEAADSAAPEEAGTMVRSAGLRLGGQRVFTVRRARHVDLREGLIVIGHDPASGLTVASTALASPIGSPVPWLGESPRSPRYMVATDVSGSDLTLRPVFVGGFDQITDALGPAVWRPRTRMDLTSGTILFTLEGELVGIIVDDGGGSLVVLPGQTVLDLASELEIAGLGVAGDLGVQVQRLTPALASATGSSNGVVVAWVEPSSYASDVLAPGDVVDTWNGQRLQTTRDWEVRVARLRAGDAIRLGVRARGEAREVTLPAAARVGVAPPSAPVPSLPLGLTMRRLDGRGSAVTRVVPGSSADRAGLTRGDIVTRVGSVAAPTPQQMTRAFSAERAGAPLLVAVTRDGRHFVTTLGK
jgi:hypothetical protein